MGQTTTFGTQNYESTCLVIPCNSMILEVGMTFAVRGASCPLLWRPTYKRGLAVVQAISEAA